MNYQKILVYFFYIIGVVVSIKSTYKDGYELLILGLQVILIGMVYELYILKCFRGRKNDKLCIEKV